MVLHSKKSICYNMKSKSFGERIKNLRKQKGFSQRKFAIQLGITSTYISKIERGEFPPPSEKVIKDMANLLNHNPHDLLAYADKVDSELLAIIKKKPQKYAQLIKETAN